MQRDERLTPRARGGAEPRERVAPTPEGREAVGRLPHGLRPQDRVGPWRYPSSPPKLTWRPATEHRQCAGSFSYISFYHICMARMRIDFEGALRGMDLLRK